MDSTSLREQFRQKMCNAGIDEAVTERFLLYYDLMHRDRDPSIKEHDIEPLPHDAVASIRDVPERSYESCREILQHTAVVKLNGGLGTTMGLDRPKSLLRAKNDYTFLDIIVRHIGALNSQYGIHIPLIFMNSFATDAMTMEWLARYGALHPEIPSRFLQHVFPKVDAQTLAPARCPSNPRLEWNPPGHGEIYTALFSSGMLDTLRAHGYRYAFISNADNLPATPDARIASFFASRKAWFMMEITRRTEADKKGGHLAVRTQDGKLLLREKAQCRDKDREAFQDISRHRYFNTNNIWIDLHMLNERKEAFFKTPLPLIVNRKHIDPTDETSASVYQLETAMGAAIGLFEDAAVLEVDRDRFLPVKTNDDLALVRSDRYRLDEQYRVVAR